jgi:cytochrome oxidase Cu insertion factor (SCO1/SenC/PrrC family)
MGKRAPLTLSKATPLALLLVFGVPLLVATVVYFFHGSLPMPRSKTHGILINPARPLERFSAQTSAGKPLSLDDILGKWTLVYVAGNKCDLYCEASLFKTRQARLALGEDIGRVQRLYLVIDRHTLNNLPSVLSEHPRMTVAAIDKTVQPAVMEVLGKAPVGQVYIIDPLGNVMMRYPPTATSKGMLKDLKHLLRVSQIG